MLAGVQMEDLTPSEMHANLACSSTLIDDVEGALHHLEHFADRLGSGPALESRVAEIRNCWKPETLAKPPTNWTI